MKTSIKILFLFLCVLILSACANPFKKTEMAQDQGKVYSCNDLKGDTARENCIMETGQAALGALRSEILRTFDTKRCVELPQGVADDCVNMIKQSGVTGPISDDQILALQEAMVPSYKTTEGSEGEVANEEAVYDIAKCAELKSADLKVYCEKRINIQIEQEKMSKIIESGDGTRCDELKDESIKESCKMELGVATEEPIAEPAPVAEDTGNVMQ